MPKIPAKITTAKKTNITANISSIQIISDIFVLSKL